ncbi:peptidyl-prolyl cis-trans isomerase [Exilibacterium tricleocarpae]|uniref:Peptidyl-prolyl cis-trans isomerase n=2 Tax=Exilibacterium tricleocarpae TaxID=2591008 RepID=A0A545TM41_9GAMM|nr:peptidylprolyl isomerase [Exilibacterium tricleocarpae]TQV78299.1 peptidyl-prolyl cis-trans isomerase [Exilibacterium tricleocarpae]
MSRQGSRKWCLSLLLGLVLGLSQATAETGSPRVQLDTDFGEVLIELYPDKAPATVKNFLEYVDRRFYDGTIFHRVKRGFVVQGGGFTFDFVKKTTADPIPNESANGLKNTAGTLAMARLPSPDSATSQFYINLANNIHLDATRERPGYAVFGKVITGFDVVEQIARVETGLYRAHPEAPNVPVRILKARRVEQAAASGTPGTSAKPEISSKPETSAKPKTPAKPES